MKSIIFGTLIVSLIIGSGWGAYYVSSNYAPRTSYEEGVVVPPQDTSNGEVAQSTGFSFAKHTFLIPPTGSSTTELAFVAATSIRDYPMGRFTTGDGQSGTLMAYEDQVTSFENNLRAMPISVNIANTGEQFYLALLEGGERRHRTSLYLGEQIKIQSLTRSGNQVTVEYSVHDRDQTFAERPRIATTAIFDIAEGRVVQAGRTPKSEAVVVMKEFTGKYTWVKTVPKEGDEVLPGKPDTFGLLFNTNQIEIQTDCNLGSATFTAEAGSSTVFTIGEIAATKMFCESAQETIYFDMFRKVERYEEDDNGNLTLYFADDAGYMEFIPVTKALEFKATTTTP